jgi:xanthine dehydrogenase accessory factor
MREIITDITNWDEPTAIATVIETWGSAPRQVGAKLAMTPSHQLSGSVSGGCVEGAVFEAGVQTLETGKPQLLHFGVADETAFEAVGLACGGKIEVFVEPLSTMLKQFWQDATRNDTPIATATIIDASPELLGYKVLLSDDGSAVTSESHERFNEVTPHMLTAAKIALKNGQTQRLSLHTSLPTEIFVEAILPKPTLILIGGVHIAQALAPIAKTLGYRVVLIDPRAAFGNETRFPNVDSIVKEYPQRAFEKVPITRGTAIVTLTHDNKFDDPALTVALRSNAFYVGALGGKITREKRRARLLGAGLTAEQIDRLNAPIGVDIAAKTPEEIALATMAQIVAARNVR